MYSKFYLFVLLTALLIIGVFQQQKIEFKCFHCRKCNVILHDTPAVICSSPSCCYTAQIKDSHNSPSYVKRGCAQSDCENTCENLLASVKEDRGGTGMVENCKTCSANASSGCNDKSLNKRYSPIMCYECRGCNVIVSTTKTVPCANEMCCYRAVVKNYDYQPFFVVRGCMRIGSCENSCGTFNRSHVAEYPDGFVHVCIRCRMNDNDNCNYPMFTIPEYKRVKEENIIRCFKCSRCNAVNSTTANVRCRHPQCCFSALVQHEDGLFGERGCAEWNTALPCRVTCEEVARKYPVVNNTCSTCHAHDHHECNKKHYDSQVFTTPAPKVKPKSILCYQCKRCNVIGSLTGVVECAKSRCCYSALVNTNKDDMWYVVRGCVKLKPEQTCEKTCKYFQLEYHTTNRAGLMHVCTQCKHDDLNYCNNRPFYPPDTPIEMEEDETYIQCYDCKNCATVTAATMTIECRAPGCCYTAYLKETASAKLYVLRGCARYRPGRTCVHSCKDITDDFKWDHPNGNVHKCKTCGENDTDRCNSHPFYFPQATARPRHIYTQISCYQCHDCLQIDNTTRTIECSSPECCYTATMENRNYFYVNRGCSSHADCTDTCEDVQRDYLWANPKAKVLNCSTCDSYDLDECNNNAIELPAEYNHTRHRVEFWKCYRCRNCNTVTATTPTVQCGEPKSCYVALVSDKVTQPDFAVRGCGKPIANQTCYFLKQNQRLQHSTGSLGYCIVCATDRCNDNEYIGQSFIEQHTIDCYNCTNCNWVTAATPTVACSSPLCCYVQFLKVGSISVVRGCSTKLPCDQTCTAVKKRSTVFCHTCEETAGGRCNNNIYNPSHTIQCYNCEGCYSVQATTDIQTDCDTDCCVASHSISRDHVQRKCVALNGSSCERYCDHLNRGIEQYVCVTCSSDRCNDKLFDERRKK